MGANNSRDVPKLTRKSAGRYRTTIESMAIEIRANYLSGLKDGGWIIEVTNDDNGDVLYYYPTYTKSEAMACLRYYWQNRHQYNKYIG